MADNNCGSTAKLPEILAPAGDTECFLAALAAGADGIYLGLKNFSARMQARNFGLGELARLVELAHAANCRVYVAMNNLMKQTELEQAFRLTCRLARQVSPDGLIIQDLAMLDIARQANFRGMLVLSTLSNITSGHGLRAARKLGADRVVMPRELSIDEMRELGENCPEGLDLECFVHGALCYCVSGRCYWSSYLGGHSGLRGRCVQPCRRIYARCENARGDGRQRSGGHGERLFACQDLELAPVIKTLFSVPKIASWKIEGRKKGPHYVFHAVTAYRMLRDNPEEAQTRKMAREFLEMALGRPGVRARFLPQKKYQPMSPGGQTSSGLLAGKTGIQQNGACVLRPRFDLLPRDRLRVGVQDENWHTIINLGCRIPKGSAFVLNLPKHKTPKAGTAVYLVDRREDELLKILKQWKQKLAAMPTIAVKDVTEKINLRPQMVKKTAIPDMELALSPPKGKFAANAALSSKTMPALWLSPKILNLSRTLLPRLSLWLAPAIWPEHESAAASLINRLLRHGARNWVLNAPWQRAFFPDSLPEGARLTAGPFCNIANSLAIAELASLGFAAAFVSPELAERDIKALPSSSTLPLGLILGGYWPLGVSRFGLAGITSGESFASPHGEIFWSKDRDGLTWLYAAWQLDITEKRKELEKCGYSFFGWLNERPPALPKLARISGQFNWQGRLL